FLLFIPVGFGINIMSIKDVYFAVSAEQMWIPYMIAFLAAMIATYYALKAFIHIMMRGKLVLFSTYCFVIGLFIILSQLWGLTDYIYNVFLILYRFFNENEMGSFKSQKRDYFTLQKIVSSYPPLTGGIKATVSPDFKTVSSSLYSSFTASIAWASKSAISYFNKYFSFNSWTDIESASTITSDFPARSCNSANNKTLITFSLLS